MAPGHEAPPSPLPPLIVLTNRAQYSLPFPWANVVRGAVRGGARAVVIREKDLPRSDRRDFAEQCLPALESVRGHLLIASDSSLALEVGAGGVHLAATDPFPPATGRPAIVGRSCHSLAEAERAAAEGCDYITLSPIFETKSKPSHGPPIDVGGLSRICASVPIPVYALGGIGSANARLCTASGAAGVAVMGVIGATETDAEAAVEALIRRLGTPAPAFGASQFMEAPARARTPSPRQGPDGAEEVPQGGEA